MRGEGFYNYAENFPRCYAYSSAGNDLAELSDGPGDDEFVGKADAAILTGEGFRHETGGFAKNLAFSTRGQDQARFYDSSGDDTFYGKHYYAMMRGDGFYNYAEGFGENLAWSTAGSDRAELYDSYGNDRLDASPGDCQIGYDGGAWTCVRGFAQVTARSELGGTDVVVAGEQLGNGVEAVGPWQLPDVLLSVPYYYQGTAEWCWAGSAACC